MKYKILKKDFDNAVKQPWGDETCLVAQAAMRLKLSDLYQLTGGHVDDALDNAADKAMDIFDKNFDLPGDEKKKPLQRLRASLPITVEI
jgi:hypothetical protein